MTTTAPDAPFRSPGTAVVLPALAAGYFVAGKLSLQLAFLHASASPVWPAAGIALAAILLFGRRVWPAIFLGAFFVNLTTAGNFATSLGIAAGNTLEGLLTAWLVERLASGCTAFERPRDVFRFAAFAGLAGALGAGVGVTSLSLGGFADWTRWGSIWLTWWLGDLGGVLMVAPLLVLWAQDPRLPGPGPRTAETLALAGAMVLVGLAVFHGLLFGTRHYPLEFLAFPILGWAAFRFGPRATISASVALSAIAVWGTLTGFGPFADEPPNVALLLLQVSLGLMTVMALAMAAAVLDERRSRAEARAAQELRQSEAARGQFIANAAHELRTPLTTMLGLVETLGAYRHKLSESEIDDHCAMIERQGERVRRLISGLLDLSRAEQGMLSVDLQRVDLAEVARHAIEDAPPASGSVSVAVAMPDSLAALADPTLLEDILINLLTNAYRYGGREVRITASEEAAGVCLVVADDGRGVPHDLVPLLFQPFARGRDHRHAEGSGLGLAIVKGLAQALGGDVAYEPGVPRGARFVLSLQRAQ